MANYSDLGFVQVSSSHEELVDKRTSSISRAGGYKARLTQEARFRVFVVDHRELSDAQKGSFETFYDTNRALELTFAWEHAPGTTYNAVFAEENAFVFKRSAGGNWDLSVRLAQVI